MNPFNLPTLLSFLLVSDAWAAISVGPGGAPLQTFDAPPPVSEWSTRSISGSSTDVRDEATLAVAVQLINASSFTEAITASASLPPLQNSLAKWSPSLQSVTTRPAGNAMTAVLATLQNDTGQGLTWFNLFYDSSAFTDFVRGPEPVPGLRVYFSLTGGEASWTEIPELSTGFPGRAFARVFISFWPPGSPLYLLWVDDNATTETDPAYTIDNVGITLVHGDYGVAFRSPSAGQTFYDDEPITVTGVPLEIGPVVYMDFYDKGRPAGLGPAPDFTMTYSNVPPGQHRLTAVAHASHGSSSESAPVEITVLDGPTPRLTITLTWADAEIAWSLRLTGLRLEATSSLTDEPWQPVTEEDHPTEGLHRVKVDVSRGNRFFRLIRSP